MSVYYIHSINSNPGLFYVFLRSTILLITGALFLRFGNHRFQLNTPLDFLLVVILGGLISRGINGSASLASTFVALFSLVLMHKLLSKISFMSHQFEKIFKGTAHLLIKNGVLQQKNLKLLNITEYDLMEQMRQQIQCASFKEIRTAYLERTGNISFIKTNQE